MNIKLSRFISIILIAGISAITICGCAKEPVADIPIVDMQLDLSTVVSSADSSVAKFNVYSPIDLEYYYADGKAISYNVCSKSIGDKLNIVSTVYDSSVGHTEVVLSILGASSSDIESYSLEIPDTDLYVSDDIVSLVARNYLACVNSGYGQNEIQTNYQCSTGYDNFFINDDGGILGVINYSYYFYSGILSESYSSFSSIACCWNNKGDLIWHVQIPQAKEEQSLYIQKSFFADGKYIVIVSKDETSSVAYVYNTVGNLIDTKEFSTDSYIFSIDDLVSVNNSKNIVFYIDSYGYTNAAYFNANTVSIGDAVDIPDYIKLHGYKSVAAGSSNDLVFSIPYGLYGYNLGDSNLTKMMDYVNSDFKGYYISDLCFNNNGSFYGTYADMTNKNSITAIFKPINASEVSDKAIIRLATYKLTSEVRSQIQKYNSSNDIYRVVVDEYSLYDTYAEPKFGCLMLSEAIGGIDAPDLVICNPGIINTYSLANNGYFIPWNYLVNSDTSFDGSNYYTFVMDNYAINGLDYVLVYDFMYSTFLGNVDIVGNNTSWSVNDMIKIAGKAPSGSARLYKDVNRDDFINKVIKFNASEFIDYDNKVSKFNSKDFINLIEYASKMPIEITKDDPNISIGRLYRNGDILLIEENVNDADEFWDDAYRYFDGNASLIGFPSSKSSSSIVEYVNTPIMIINGDNISGAWNFTKCFYNPEYQYSLSESIPVYYDAFSSWGNKSLNNDNYVMLNELGEPYYVQDTYFYDNKEHDIPAITSDNIDAIEAQIMLTTKAAFCDEIIKEIIWDEVEKYFNKSQSSKDAAKNIDSRVTAYLFE